MHVVLAEAHTDSTKERQVVGPAERIKTLIKDPSICGASTGQVYARVWKHSLIPSGDPLHHL